MMLSRAETQESNLIMRRRRSPHIDGFLTFLGTFFLGIVASFFIAGWISEKPKPFETESYETIGYAIGTLINWFWGILMSFFLALIAAADVGSRIRIANESADNAREAAITTKAIGSETHGETVT